MIPYLSVLSILLQVLALDVIARTITVYNACPFTIWPALFTGTGSARPEFPSGWEASPWTHVDLVVSSEWTAGRLWARRGCKSSNPSSSSDDLTCLSGDCNGKLRCTVTGSPPATFAEFTLRSPGPAGERDYYDVTIVDGANLPMRVESNKGCPVAECTVDLGPECPSGLKGPFDGLGFPLGCKTACMADSESGGNVANSTNCCTGDFGTPQTCLPDNVDHYKFFKDRCPDSYAYAYDDSSGLKSCPLESETDFIVTFCP